MSATRPHVRGLTPLVRATAPQQSPPSWGLDRIDQRGLPLDNVYTPLNDAAGVHIYVVDAGLRLTHQDFGGRASAGYNVFTGGVDVTDCGFNGHGTNVAGIAAGSEMGVAKAAQIVVVKVQECTSNDSPDKLADGLDWVTAHLQRPAVVNVSVGDDRVNPRIDGAVQRLLTAGATVVAAAGNSAGSAPAVDACTLSPGHLSASSALITVGATDKTDAYVATSNAGPCVTIAAPGQNILTDSDADNIALSNGFGTSFAAPHVTGVAAELLAMHPQWTPAEVKHAIVGRGTQDVLTGVPAGTPNLLLYAGPLGGPDGGALPDTDLNTMWNTYGDQGHHWTGGDQTVSVPLPDGRVAWLFSDTFLGTVNPDHSRPAGTPMIHNSLVVQQGTTLTTLTGGTADQPESLVGPPQSALPPGDLGYWVSDGTVEGDKLRVLYNHFTTSGNGPLDATQSGTFLATFSLPGLTLDGLTDLHVGASITWGAAITEDDGFDYIYGTDFVGGVKFLHLARALPGAIDGAWQFWTGIGWSTAETDAARMMSGVDGISVEKIDGSYVMVSADGDGFFSRDIVAYYAPSPTGPFADKTYLYHTPEGAPGTDTIVYAPHVHHGVGGAGPLVVSYNVNSLRLDGNTVDARIYRPRFIDVTLPSPGDPSALPRAPQRLTATSDARGVHLSWTASPTAGVSYRVYQRDVSAGQTQAVRLPDTVNGTTFDPGLLTNGDIYEFFVTAVNAAGESSGSNEVRATPNIPPPTAAPASLTATANADGTVSLSWTAVPDAGWYRVARKDTTSGETGFTDLPDLFFGTSGVARSMMDGHTYQFQVRAASPGGDGPPSPPATVTVHLPLPAAPTNLRAQPSTDGTIALDWDANPDAWFFVYMRDVTAGEPSPTRLPYPVTTNHLVAQYLSEGHTYQFSVTATDTVGESAPSNSVSATSHTVPPDAPTGLRAVAGNGLVNLTWTAVTTSAWYWIYWRDVTAGEAGYTRSQYPLDPTVTGTTFTANYLNNGDTYEFYMTATNAGGEGPASNHVTATPTEPLPGSPTGLTATALGNDTIRISWTAPGPDLWYWIYRRDVTAGEATFTKSTYPWTGGTTFTTDTLPYGHTIEFKVSATNSGGEGPPSAAARATGRLDAPTGLTAVATDNGQARLRWNSLGDNVWYWISSRDVTAGQQFQRGASPVTTPEVLWGNLVDGHTYEFKVAGTAGNGDGPASGTVQIVAHGGTPTAPHLSVSAGDGRATLAWTAPEAGAWIWVYRRCVDCGDTGFTRFSLPVTSGTTLLDSPLTNGYTYEYRVAASNSHGEGDWSNVVRVRPLPPLPSAPTGLTARAGDMQIALRWNAPGPNLYYWIYLRDVTAGQSGFTKLKYPTPNTSITLSLLQDAHSYQVYVTATNVAGEGPRSAVVSATPQPGTPTNLTATLLHSDQIGLAWSPPNPSNVYYSIYQRDITTGESFRKLLFPAANPGATLGNFHHGHTYEFFVTSIRGAGESAPSNSVRMTLEPDDGATTCATVASNFQGVLGSDKDLHYVQRRDMKLTACLIFGPVVSTGHRQMTVRMNWDTSGNKMLDASLWYYLVDCSTGDLVYYDYRDIIGQDIRTGSNQFTITVDATHLYRAYATGDGHLSVGAPGTIGHENTFLGRYAPAGIDNLQPRTNCY
jgi:fibronectin type 3 domain-containing protein